MKDNKKKDNYSNQPKDPKKLSERHIYNLATFYLKRFSATSHSLRAYLVRKSLTSTKFHGQNMEDAHTWIEIAIEKLTQAGVLNDQRYTKAKISYLLRHGHSQKKIILKLKEKGIDESLTKQALTEIIQEENLQTSNIELISASKYVKKRKFGAFRTVELDEKRKNKELSALARQGFSFEISLQALNLTSSDHEKLNLDL